MNIDFALFDSPILVNFCLILLKLTFVISKGNNYAYYSYDYGTGSGGEISRSSSGSGGVKPGRGSSGSQKSYDLSDSYVRVRPTVSIECYSCRSDILAEPYWSSLYSGIFETPLSSTPYCQTEMFDRRHIRYKMCDGSCVWIRANGMFDGEFFSLHYRGCESDLLYLNSTVWFEVRQRNCMYVTYRQLFSSSRAQKKTSTLRVCACQRSLCNAAVASNSRLASVTAGTFFYKRRLKFVLIIFLTHLAFWRPVTFY